MAELSYLTIDLLKCSDKLKREINDRLLNTFSKRFFSTFAHFIKKNKWNISYLH